MSQFAFSNVREGILEGWFSVFSSHHKPGGGVTISLVETLPQPSRIRKVLVLAGGFAFIYFYRGECNSFSAVSGEVDWFLWLHRDRI